MREKQRTLGREISISGTGLHTGQEVFMKLKPAGVNEGVSFIRTDKEGNPKIKANAEFVTDVSRGTTISDGEVRISTIEHALAALTGMGIDNVEIELDGDEVPILDGSSLPFVNLIKEAGSIEQSAERNFFKVTRPIKYTDQERGIEIIALPDDDYNVTVNIDYNSPVLGPQNAQLSNLTEFESEISPCRTFCFLHEIEYLFNNNLIKGGDLSNAIVVVDKVVEKKELDRLAALFDKPSVEVKEEGVLNNIDLHFSNEPARHKLLDVIGDLSLVGRPIKGKIIATKPGHAANVEFAKLIQKAIKMEKTAAPLFDVNAEPVFNIQDIMKFLPHRQPFLLVDKILEMDEERIVGLKNVTMNEEFFKGHFPGEPVMPGVLIIEAMAQTGGVLVLNTVPDPENYLTYFLKIDKVRFKKKVSPGDTLIFDLKLLSPIRRGICHMEARAYVGDKVVTEAELMAQIVKVK